MSKYNYTYGGRGAGKTLARDMGGELKQLQYLQRIEAGLTDLASATNKVTLSVKNMLADGIPVRAIVAHLYREWEHYPKLATAILGADLWKDIVELNQKPLT